MASFTKRNGIWRCLVRRKGYKPVSKSFKTKASAQKWALSVEADMDAALSVEDIVGQGVTFKECLERYAREITPLKKGCSRELLRLKALCKDPLATLPITDIKPRHLAAWRDDVSWKEWSPKFR